MSVPLDEPRKRGITGRHVLWLMLGFFAVIVMADATMIYQALSTFGGVDNPSAYRDGLAYNARIARAERQLLTGWQDTVEVVPAPRRLRATLRERNGAAVAGKHVVAEIERPATSRYDRKLAFDEVSPGVYEAALPPGIDGGTWVVDLSALEAGASAPAFQTRRRLWIAP
jgi:nitrogen fixation protein FixH